MVYISVIFTFDSSPDNVIKVTAETFFTRSKTKLRAIVLWYYKIILLAREQVFFVQFLLIDITHDAVSNCSKITFC